MKKILKILNNSEFSKNYADLDINKNWINLISHSHNAVYFKAYKCCPNDIIDLLKNHLETFKISFEFTCEDFFYFKVKKI